MTALIAWVGKTDQLAAQGEIPGKGPIAGLLTACNECFDIVWLLGAGYSKPDLEKYQRWLRKQSPQQTVSLHVTPIKSEHVTDYARLLAAAVEGIEALRQQHRDIDLAYHLSPGTPAMIVINVLLSQTRFPGQTYQSYFDPETRRQSGEEVRITPLWLSVLPNVLTAELRAAQLPARSSFITHNEDFRKIVRRVELTASETNAPLLIIGETGTGKEGLARIAHESSGVKGEFVPLNCGAIPNDLFESTLFGHKKGAFTGAVTENQGKCIQAANGTLFLDEVSELRPDHQVKLLRALQSNRGKFEIIPVGGVKARRVSFRLVAACNRDLKQMVWSEDFRQDFYYRISTVEIRVPPLRERPEDVMAFVECGLVPLLDEIFGESRRRAPRRFTEEALHALAYECDWSGNYRSLQRVLIRIHLDMSDEPVSKEEVLSHTREFVTGKSRESFFEDIPLSDYSATLMEIRRSFLKRAYVKAGFNKEAAAALLGLKTGQTFSDTAKRIGLTLERPKKRR